MPNAAAVADPPIAPPAEAGGGEQGSVPASRRRAMRDALSMGKPRIALMAALAAGLGYAIGAIGPLATAPLLTVALGVALAAAGSSTLNMVIERDLDARMPRTRNRPLPTGRLSVGYACLQGAVTTLAGALIVGSVNPQAGLLTLITGACYLLIYTPLKTRTTLNTVIGAIPGALPPVVGYLAAAGRLDATAWMLFGVLFFWQVPHFLAIAWIYRDDYAEAGMQMLPVIDQRGAMTGRQMVLYAVALIGCSCAPFTAGQVGGIYLIGALVLGSWMLIGSLRFLVRPDVVPARSVFVASLIYLPVVYALWLIDKA